jgi:hypothetical protein
MGAADSKVRYVPNLGPGFSLTDLAVIHFVTIMIRQMHIDNTAWRRDREVVLRSGQVSHGH